jgi:hypothetical protein
MCVGKDHRYSVLVGTFPPSADIAAQGAGLTVVND